jgi:exopolyphosphatase/guanosine-5'-triphosphate,3'-diphosphate pyrophosphatase
VRVAAVDLGTNSTRLLVADVVDHVVVEVARRLTITRLGAGVDVERRLDAQAVARVRTCLDGYSAEIDALGVERTLAIATSAVRDAEDGSAFLAELGKRYSFTTRLLSGAEEAALTLAGVRSDRELPPDTLVVDIGGGSTELVVGGEDVTFSSSLQLGCVRVTERFLGSDPPTVAELERCSAYVRRELPRLEAVRAAVGVAGTVTTIAALDLGLVAYDATRVHGHRIAVEAVEREVTRLAALTTEERRRLPAMEHGRAPVIVGGGVILREIMRAYGLREIEASERDLLHGVALAAAA